GVGTFSLRAFRKRTLTVSASSSSWSNRALKIGPGGVISYIVQPTVCTGGPVSEVSIADGILQSANSPGIISTNKRMAYERGKTHPASSQPTSAWHTQGGKLTQHNLNQQAHGTHKGGNSPSIISTNKAHVTHKKRLAHR
ncbi:unnamed protein product, partial [Ectocarpus sp. 4 AP-2014]